MIGKIELDLGKRGYYKINNLGEIGRDIMYKYAIIKIGFEMDIFEEFTPVRGGAIIESIQSRGGMLDKKIFVFPVEENGGKE